MNVVSWGVSMGRSVVNWQGQGTAFFLFYPENRNQLRKAMRHAELEEMRSHFDFEDRKMPLS
jgi:hypothetical protein